MGIQVRCPNGHEFKVKDKYAGKKGICPFCPGQVTVRVPDATSSDQLSAAAYRAVREELEHHHHAPDASSVLEDHYGDEGDSSGSLLGSSVVRHNIKCKCGERVPMWYAKCPKCGTFLEHW